MCFARSLSEIPIVFFSDFFRIPISMSPAFIRLSAYVLLALSESFIGNPADIRPFPSGNLNMPPASFADITYGILYKN